MHRRDSKILSLIFGFILIFQQSGFAQLAAEFDIAGHIANFHNSFVIDKFRPIHLRYLQYDPLNNNFRLFLDKGDQFQQPNETNKLDEQAKELLKYFYIGLTLPNFKFWVNLRPDAEYNIIDDYLAKTDIGRIMLETDLQLKKDTAAMTSPQTPEGRQYWDKLYKKASELYGYDNVTIPTLTRPWIVPGEIIIRETKDSAYIYKATLKVMLEQDYIATSESAIANSADYSFKDGRAKALNEYSTQLIRELIIPKLTKEVNSSKRYAGLRQVYYSLIMAQWFKARFRGVGGPAPKLIDSQDLANLTSKDSWSKTTYFQAYHKSFKDGEYNIQEPVYTPTGQVIRSYFSGGEMLGLTNIPFGDISGPVTSIRVNSSPVINKSQGDSYYLIETEVPNMDNPGTDRGSSAVANTTEAAVSFLKTELYNYLVGLCRDNMLVKTRGIKVSSYRQLLIRAARIDPEIATYLEKVIEIISNITLFKGADEDTLEEAVIALNDHGFKKYGLCISLDSLVYRESPEEKPLLTSLDYRIYKILDVEAALNPLMPENRINVYILDEVATDYKKAIAGISPLLPREKSGHMFKDREALTSKETGLAGPKVYIREAQEEIESAKIGPSHQEDRALSLLGGLVRKFYNAETDENLLKLERRRIAAHEVGHVYVLFTVSEILDEESDELLAYLYSLMEGLEGNKAYLAKLIIKAMQIESSDIKYFDHVTGSIYIPPPLQAFVTLKEKFKNVLGIPSQSNLELANRITALDERDIPELARTIFKSASGKKPVAISWQAASPVRAQRIDLAMTREEKLKYIKAVYDGSTGGRILNTSGEGFRTMSIYNYYYRSGSFRSPSAYLWQIEMLGKELDNPDIFSDLLSFVKKLTAEEGRVFYLYSVINPNGSLGLGLRSSMLEGEPLLTTSRNDLYGKDHFTVFVGQELFEYLTRRNSADDLPDVDLFVTYELIWQEILRYYFKETDPKVITKIKAAIKKEADEEREFQKELSHLMRDALNASSGWDRDLGGNEIYIRALARKLSETQAKAWAKFYGWREIGVALFDNDLIERMNENLHLDISAIGSGQMKALPPPERNLQPDKLLTSSSEDIPGVSPSELALAIANGQSVEELRSKAEQLSEEDKGLFRYLSLLKDELLKTEGAQREFRLIGSHLPASIGQAVAFLEVAFFPPVGANFSSSLGEFLGGGKGTTETSPMVVYSFSPNVSFSFRARQRSEKDYEIQITPMDDPHKSPVTVVRIPKDASFEEVLIRVIKALPEQPKALFYNTSIQGFRKLADSLLKAPKESQIEILRKFSKYISSHSEQRAFNDSLPYGTEYIPPIILANELAFWVQDTQKGKFASMALASLQQVFGNIAGYINNLQRRKTGVKSLTTGNTGNKPKEKNPPDKEGNSASPVSQAMIKETLNSTDKGGIDFRDLPIITQAMSNLKLSVSSSLSLDRLQNINSNQKLRDIQKMVKAGIVPSTDRIKEYVASSCLKGDLDIQKIISCIANILRLEEEHCTQTDSMLRDILVVLESSGSMEHLRAVFSRPIPQQIPLQTP